MVKRRLGERDVQQQGWLLDGYPRSAEQAQAIEAVGIRPDVFLVIKVSDDLLVQRVAGRRMDPETGHIYHLQFKPPPEDVVQRCGSMPYTVLAELWATAICEPPAWKPKGRPYFLPPRHGRCHQGSQSWCEAKLHLVVLWFLTPQAHTAE
jgi:Adenylate kinase